MSSLLLVLFEYRSHWSENMNSERHTQPRVPISGKSCGLCDFQPSSLLKLPWGFRESQLAADCRNQRHSHFTSHSLISEFNLIWEPVEWINPWAQTCSDSFFHTLLVKCQVLKAEGPSPPTLKLRETWWRFYCCLQLLSGETEKRGTESSGKHTVIKNKGCKLVAMQVKKIRQGLFFETMLWLSTRIGCHKGCIISFLAYSQNSLECGHEQPKLRGPAVGKGLDKTTS